MNEGKELLRGWRAIADHLGRSVRTVQRWEDQHALPVAREGDSVVARPEELDRWLRTWARYGALPDCELPDDLADHPDETPAPSPPTLTLPTTEGAGQQAVGTPVGPPETAARRQKAPRQTHSRRTGLVARLGLLLLVTAPLAGYVWIKGVAGSGQPAAWRIAGRTLFVSDAAGRLLFSHPVESGTPRVFTRNPRYADPYQNVRFLDLDEDGSLEVLVRTPLEARAPGQVICLEADGRLRFAVPASGSRRFGHVDYGEPWYPGSIHSTARADGTRSLWVAWVHHTWFPSRVQQLSAAGKVLGEYWSNGHIHSVGEARLAGRDVVLVGATNNESRGGSLTILDRARVGGRAPAVKDDYSCHDCGGDDPLAFLVFPSSCIWRRDGGGTAVVGASVGADGRLEVVVSGGQAEIAGPLEASRLTYRFSRELELESVRVERDFVRLHALLFGRGLLDHRLGPADEAGLFPVRRWDGSGFVELPAVPVER